MRASSEPACLQDFVGLVPVSTTSTVPCVAARTLFAEDFETGDYARWTGQRYTGFERSACSTSGISTDRAVSGKHSSRAQVTCASGDSHRPYGAIQLRGDRVSCGFTNAGVGVDAPHGVVTTFWGWLEVPYDFGGGKWFSYFTINPACDFTDNVVTFSLYNAARDIEAAHIWDTGGRVQLVPNAPKMPLGQWVRTTGYVNFAKGELTLWMDGVKVLDATFSRRTKTMCQFHWGLYASPGNTDLTYYEDDIALYVLDQPLTDRVREPWFGHTVSMCAP